MPGNHNKIEERAGAWFEFAPRSEQEVVALFGLLLPRLPIRVLINEVREAFPDCEAWLLDENGQRKLLRIEFELRASNFVAHEHDPDGCDLIVCWEDDMGDFKVPRLALSSVAASLDPPVIQFPDRVKYPPRVWTEEQFLQVAPAELRQNHREFLQWAKSVAPRGRVTFGEGNQFASWSFAVNLRTGKRITLLGVYPDGTVWVQPQSLSDSLGELYRRRLAGAANEADLGKQWFLHKGGIANPDFLAAVKEGVKEVLKGIAAGQVCAAGWWGLAYVLTY